jgi:hypothetical protein
VFALLFPWKNIVATIETQRRKTAMCSEAERITNEVMDRHAFGKLAEHPGGAHLQKTESHHRSATGPHSTNISGFMETEKTALEGPIPLP